MSKFKLASLRPLPSPPLSTYYVLNTVLGYTDLLIEPLSFLKLGFFICKITYFLPFKVEI